MSAKSSITLRHFGHFTHFFSETQAILNRGWVCLI